MNTSTTKPDDKKAATPAASNAKSEACATTAAKSQGCGQTHDGKVVSISGNKLVMSGHDGKEHTHTVATDAKVCCDGKACKATDLKVGNQIRVTTMTDDKHVATKIESLDKQAKFAQSV